MCVCFIVLFNKLTQTGCGSDKFLCVIDGIAYFHAGFVMAILIVMTEAMSRDAVS